MKLLSGMRALLQKDGHAVEKIATSGQKTVGSKATRILEAIMAEKGPTVARVVKGFIDQYPFLELANTPGMFFVPEHEVIQKATGLTVDLYWKAVNAAIEAGYIKKQKIEGRLMFEVQFKELDSLLDR